jgi:hypothetical protein
MVRYSVNGHEGSGNVVEGKVIGGKEQEPDDADRESSWVPLPVLPRSSLMRRKSTRRHLPMQCIAPCRSGSPRQSTRLQRFEAAKANKDRAILNAELVQQQGEYFRRGKYYVMQVLKDVYDMDEDVPEDLLPIAQAFTKYIADALPGTFVEGGTMIGELGLEEIALATKPPRDEYER